MTDFAASIAPALNDLLSVVIGRTNQLLDSPATDTASRESLRQIHTAADRALGLTRQLLLFSGRHPFHPHTVDLNHLLEELAPGLRQMAGDRIEVQLRPGSGLPFVTADEALLEQALLGLFWNARKAMPDGGRLSVSSGVITIDHHELAGYPEGRPGTFATLVVADTGAGMTPEAVGRLFEPCFDHADASETTGLGLALVRTIVRQHRGWITVDTRPGNGTRFTVFLPAAPAGTPVEPYPKPNSAELKGTETILVLEDDPLVREFTAAVLRDFGYRVLQAGSIDEARETWMWHRERIAALVSDIVLPGSVSGPQFANQVHAEKPGLAVVLISGHDRSILRQTPAVPATFQYLQKPWRPQTLARLLRQELDTR